LLDADMEFIPGTLREQTLTETGYSIIQSSGSLEYPNCRIIRMDYNWVCRGVTHEYWDGPTTLLSKSVCYIDDKNDGGCKSDKFERDARLLEAGLLEDPKNVRYMFYLAQTYNSIGRYADAIKYYKQRIKAGGWYEEVWYSHFMIGNCYFSLNDPIRAESWMLRAFKLHPARSENLYKLARYFREKGEHVKAWHYTCKGLTIPKPKDSLFLETNVYDYLFEYEATIILYYLGKTREGLRRSMKYLLAYSDLRDTVYRNMSFYVEPLAKNVKTHPVPRNAAGLNFHPSSVSIFGKHDQNVRFVNYEINQSDGSYIMKEGSYSTSHKVRTENVYWNGHEAKLMKVVTDLPKRDSRIMGLEDMRVYRDANNSLRFLATNAREFSDTIRTVSGTYDIDKAECRDLVVVESPKQAECEKNWIPIDHTNDIVYGWSPLTVGHLEGAKFVEDHRHTTPWFFTHLRGSASPIRVRNELWFLVHFVEYSAPRKYFHMFVSTDPVTYAPKAITLPFVFAASGIEYCLGIRMNRPGIIETAFSCWDNNPCTAELRISELEWIQV
jgi:tetratricopeptide (TPR) repeat protein